MKTTQFLAFWSINAPLDVTTLLRQVREMRRLGLDGVVWHPRFYPNRPEYLGHDYMRVVSRVILEARDLGMAFWIYDEDGWPSGTVGGRLPRQHPHLRNQMLVAEAEPAQGAVGAIFSDAAGRCSRRAVPGGRTWHLNVRRGPGLNYLDPAATARFLEMTHDAYARGLDPQAFAHVEALFSDEPEFGLTWEALPPCGAIPWADDLPEQYRRRTGRDLLADLPRLFLPGPDDAAVRVAFWELAVDRLIAGFLGPYQQWCDRHGKRFTVHFKGEEHPLFQLPNMTSLSQAMREVSLPAYDALERQAPNDLFPRQVASTACQFGDGRCMVECFGGAGWGAQPADLERFLVQLIRMGATDLVAHLWHYELTDQCRRDWPPSHPVHMTWREAMPELLARVRRQAADLTRRFAQAGSLLVVPSRAVAARYEPWQLPLTNVHDARDYPDTSASRLSDAALQAAAALAAQGVSFHVTDERTLQEHGRREGERQVVGRCTYPRVVRVEGCLLDRPSNGGTIQSDGAWHACPAWSVRRPINRLVLDVAEPAALERRAGFEMEEGVRSALRLELLSEPRDLRINGHAAAAAVRQEVGWSVDLPGELLGRANTLAWRVPDDPHCRGPAMAAIVGDFRLHAEAPWQRGPNGVIVRPAPLRIAAAQAIDALACVECGYPFTPGPFIGECSLELERRLVRPRLTFFGVAADALRVTVDGADLGWCWAPDWSVTIASVLEPGRHVIRLELVPSTFNVYGPHHYIYGDRHVISPDQFTGARNFADPLDAPARTLDSAWRVRPVRFPRELSLCPSSQNGT